MKMENRNEEISRLLVKIQDIKEQIERLQDEKSKISLELFYDTENQDLIQELEKLKDINAGLNSELNQINEELLKTLNDEKKDTK